MRFETGSGLGRFALRPATPGDAPGTALATDWVLQVGPRAEFLLKDPFSESGVIPFSIGAALRLTVPINGEARALRRAIGTIEFQW